MADLSITATQVLKGSGAVVANGTAGATITAGQTLYADSTDSNKLKLAQADGTAAEATCVGIALHAAGSGQPIQYQTGGTITIGAGAAPAEGMIYVLSDTAGGLAPHTDADDPVSTEYTSIIGAADGSNGIVLKILNSGQQTA